MQRKFLSNYFMAVLLISSLLITACKDKSKENTGDSVPNSTAPVDTATTQIPVEVSSDEALTTGVRDATKDFPGVTATVANGEITLTGDISREKLPTLMSALNSLQPKKINNNLTIK